MTLSAPTQSKRSWWRRVIDRFRPKPQLVFSRSKKAAKALTDNDQHQKLARELASKGKYVPKHFRQAVKHG